VTFVLIDFVRGVAMEVRPWRKSGQLLSCAGRSRNCHRCNEFLFRNDRVLFESQDAVSQRQMAYRQRVPIWKRKFLRGNPAGGDVSDLKPLRSSDGLSRAA
jgi:hypothetical protein